MKYLKRYSLLFIFFWLLQNNVILAASPETSSNTNPFRSLLPPSPKTAILYPLKPNKIKKTKSSKKPAKVKKVNKNQTSNKTSKKNQLSPPVGVVETQSKATQKKTNPQHIFLVEVLNTSEGLYAFISQNKVTYFLQAGEYFDDLLVEKIEKDKVILKNMNKRTKLVLHLNL